MEQLENLPAVIEQTIDKELGEEILKELKAQNRTLQTLLNYVAITFWGSILLGALAVFALN